MVKKSEHNYISCQNEFEGLTVLVTGASGFLGRKIYNTFSRRYRTIGTYFRKRVSGIDFLPVDIINQKDVKNLFKENDFECFNI